MLSWCKLLTARNEFVENCTFFGGYIIYRVWSEQSYLWFSRNKSVDSQRILKTNVVFFVVVTINDTHLFKSNYHKTLKLEKKSFFLFRLWLKLLQLFFFCLNEKNFVCFNWTRKRFRFICWVQNQFEKFNSNLVHFFFVNCEINSKSEDHLSILSNGI